MRYLKKYGSLIVCIIFGTLLLPNNLMASSSGTNGIRLKVSDHCYQHFPELIQHTIKIVFKSNDDVRFEKISDTSYMQIGTNGKTYWVNVNMLNIPVRMHNEGVLIARFRLSEGAGYKFRFGMIYAKGQEISDYNSEIFYTVQSQRNQPVILTEYNSDKFPLADLHCAVDKSDDNNLVINCQCLPFQAN